MACSTCTLWRNPSFEPLSRDELAFVAGMRVGQVSLRAGEHLVLSDSNAFFTLYEGWAAHTRYLTDGSRQILDVCLPGDMLGLSTAVLQTGGYSILAITDVALCVLDKAQLPSLFGKFPDLAFRLFATRVQNQERADARLLAVGQMEAGQRVAHLLLDVHEQLGRRGMSDGNSAPFPLQRMYIADAVGLSRAHVMRALRELRRYGLATIVRRKLTIPDVHKLTRYCDYSSVRARACVIL